MDMSCSKTTRRSSILGFTLIELLITLAIIGILAIIAVPSYMRYTRRSYFSEIVKAVAPFKIGVAACYNKTSDLTACDGGTNDVPPDRGAAGGVTSVVTVNGVITVTPVAQNGILATDLYVLTPTADAATGVLTWTASGAGVTKGYAS